jgi:putative oxidoreductase
MQRFFATYPGGTPAVGLLLLRSVIGIVLIGRGVAIVVDENTPTLLTGIAASGTLTGVSLLLGFLTPMASALAMLCSCAAFLQWIPVDALSSPQVKPAAALLAFMALSLALLGPGAFSIDSRLFGRREIVIPPLTKTKDRS